MNGKERTTAILNREPVDRAGFWLGNPADETKKIYCEYFGIENNPIAYPARKDENKTGPQTTKINKADIKLASVG